MKCLMKKDKKEIKKMKGSKRYQNMLLMKFKDKKVQQKKIKIYLIIKNKK